MPNNDDMAPDASGPLGSGNHTVREGECINSIAAENGLFWETIWNDGGNSALRDKRANPDLLLPGDKLVVPAKRVEEVSGATEQRHRFKRNGVPVSLVIRIMKDQTESRAVECSADDNTPWSYDDNPHAIKEATEPEAESAQPYRLCIDGIWTDGKTDGNGKLTATIQPNARTARLVLRPGAKDERIIELELGGMDPVSEPPGAAKRLRNLGYPCEVADDMSPGIVAALQVFQRDRGLDPTGKLDKKTQDALRDRHGS